MVVKVTAERLKEVWNLPGNVGTSVDLKAPSPTYCAGGKIGLLMNVHPNEAPWHLFPDEVLINNTSNINSMSELAHVYGNTLEEMVKYRSFVGPNGYALPFATALYPGMPQWDRHILAFKRMLQKCIFAGLIELEDEAAAEFAALSTKETATV